jgi:hypothetical protein
MLKKFVLIAVFVAAGAISAQAQTQHSQLAKSAGLTQEQAAGMSLDDIAEAKRLAEGNANN